MYGAACFCSAKRRKDEKRDVKQRVSGNNVNESRKIWRLKKVVQIKRWRGGGNPEYANVVSLPHCFLKVGAQVIDCAPHQPGD